MRLDVLPSIGLRLAPAPNDLPSFLAATRPRVPNAAHNLTAPIRVRGVDRDATNDDGVQGHGGTVAA
jgi:hypothetical protein